jgi:CheY-like chemotaxis protein
VSLPLLADAGRGPPPHRGTANEWPLEATALAGLRVLVVEDEPDSREFVRLSIESAGARVAAAASAAEAMSLLASFRPDALLCDIRLPDEDGYELIRRLRARPPEQGGDIPAIALTGEVREVDAGRALAAGFNAHIGKPVWARDVIVALAALVSRPAGTHLGG